MTQESEGNGPSGEGLPLVATRRAKTRARGASMKDLVSELERDHPDLAERAGVSSAAVEAGDMIRAARQAAGLSQRELANAAGLHQSAISAIERGEGKDGPTYRKMRAIAEALGMRIGFVSDTVSQGDVTDHAVVAGRTRATVPLDRSPGSWGAFTDQSTCFVTGDVSGRASPSSGGRGARKSDRSA